MKISCDRNNSYVKVATYLTEQFHCHGYSIEQRLFILEILSVSSLRLSNSHDVVSCDLCNPYCECTPPCRKEPISLYQ